MRVHPILLLIPILLALSSIPSETAIAGPFKALAIKGGAYSGSQDYDFGGERLFDPSSVWSGTLGLSTEWKFSRKSKIHFLLEGQYFDKRIKDTLVNTDTGLPEEINAGITYLTVPILAKLRTADAASSLYFLVGFSVDFILDREEVPAETLNQVIQDFNDTQFSVQVGLGIEHNFGRQMDGILEFRYTQNVANIYGGGDLGEDIRLNGVRQRGIMFLAGARYRFGRM